MLDLQSAIALSELTEAEVRAIAEHEQIPEMQAAEMGAYLLETAAGEKRISAMIRDDIEAAQARGDHRRAAELKMVLKHFIATHAGAEPAAKAARPTGKR